jgi:hypothetical protein
VAWDGNGKKNAKIGANRQLQADSFFCGAVTYSGSPSTFTRRELGC